MPASPTSAAKGGHKIKPIGQTSGKHFGTDDRNRPLESAALAELDVAETQELRLRERIDSDIAAAERLHVTHPIKTTS